jgi:hypothetical protein
MTKPFIQTMYVRRISLDPGALGHVSALYIKVRTEDYRQLTWSEVWEVFADRYPGRWAVQFFPPAEDLVDEVNVYHLFVLQEEPLGVNIKERGYRAKETGSAGQR